MCGIAAIFNNNQKPPFLKDSIIRMISSLSHRGPDGSGIYITNNIALGQRRLSIIDLVGGKQPMITDRYVIVYNGEIFNSKHQVIQKLLLNLLRLMAWML